MIDTKSVQNAIVRIIDMSERTIGTGFVVSAQGHIFTCWHVIENLLNIQVSFDTDSHNRLIQATLLSNISNKDADIAILQVSALPRECIPLNLSLEWEIGELIWSYGYQYQETFPGGYPLEGRISGDTQMPKNQQLLVVSATDVQRGLSGAPAISQQTGKVIGMINAKFDDKGIGLAIPIATFTKYWNELTNIVEVPSGKLLGNVKELFKAMGYSLFASDFGLDIQDAFVAKFKAGPTTLSTGIVTVDALVESLSGVEKFVYALERRIDNKDIDKGMIITRKILDDHKDLSSSSRVQLLSYEELQNSLLDFSEYIDSVIYDYENFGEYSNLQKYPMIETFRWCDLNRYFVSPNSVNLLTGETNNDVLKLITDWSNSNSGNHLSILGDYGTGKTSLCLEMTYKFCKAYRQNPMSKRIPVFIPLRNFDVRNGDVQRLILETLNEYGIRIADYAAFDILLRAGKLLIIFDGFDEMADSLSRQNVLSAFDQLSRLVTPNSKVILTCRTHYFRNESQSIDILTNEKMTPLMREVSKRQEYQVIQLMKFSHDQVLELISRYTKNPDKLWKEMQSIYDLTDLVKTPILLSMIIKTLPQLLEIRGLDEVTSTSLYDVYTKYWLERDDERSDISKEEKMLFTQELAWQMYTTNKLSISADDLNTSIKKHFSDHGGNGEWLSKLDTNIRTCSFLARDKHGNYNFAHKSFMEFFVAKYLVGFVGQWHTSNFWERIVPYEVIAFLQDLLSDDDWITVKSIALDRGNHDLLRSLCMDLLISIGNTIKDEPLIFRLKFSSDDSTIAVVTADSNCYVVDVTSMKIVSKLVDHQDWVRGLAFSSDKSFLATAGWDNKVIIWSVGSYEKVFELDFPARMNAVCFSPSNSVIACGGFNNEISIWDCNSKTLIATLLGHSDNIRELSFDPTGRFLLSCSLDTTLRIWDLQNPDGSPVIRIQDEPVTAATFSKDGKYVVSGSWTGNVTCWDAKTFEKIWSTQGHSNMTNTFSFGPDSEFFASCSDDHKIKIWSSKDGDVLRTINGGEDFLSGVSFSSDGKLLCSGGYDCKIRVWNTDNWELIGILDLLESHH